MKDLPQRGPFDAATPGGLYLAGTLSPALTDSLYPLKALTKWHAANHIKGLTGRWMDGGHDFLTGVTRGSYHRLTHGHHLLEDGFRVVMHPKLSFGQFLHHLGLDSLTERGIPNPLLPTALRGLLLNAGLPPKFVYELMTINVPKVLSGGLGLIVAGNDAYLAFSDAIPHTFMAAGFHAIAGIVEIGLGLYPPNILLLASGAIECGVGLTTAFRTVMDAVSPEMATAASSVYLPAIGASVGLGAVLGACGGWWTGGSWESSVKGAAVGATAAAVSSSVATLAASAGYLAPFLGAGAGAATAMILREIMRSEPAVPVPYVEYTRLGIRNPFDSPMGIPLVGYPRRPIGRLEGDSFEFDAESLADGVAAIANRASV